jgi:hypothetical protein
MSRHHLEQTPVDLEKAGTLSTRDCEDVYHRIRYHLTNAKWEYNVNMRRATFHFILYVGHCAKQTWPQFNIIIVYCNKLYIAINFIL